MNSDIQLYQSFFQAYVIPWGIKLVTAIAIMVIGMFMAKIVIKLIRKALTKAKLDKTLNDFLSSIAHSVIMVVIIVAALEQIGIDTTSILAVFAAAGLAIGLAFKDSLSNLASGIMLVIFKPFKLGDFIEAAGVSGVVESIRIFSTIMKTGDNREITVPNSQIYSGIITNFNARPTRRIDLVIGISYNDNIGKAKQIISDIVQQDSRILPEPQVTIMVLELGESSIDIAVRPWVNTADYWPARADLLQSIKERFDAEGISIPFPSRDIYMHPHTA